MKTKIIPFDLETAKKIQAGEIEGRIVRSGAQKQVCEILEFYAEWQTHCDEKFLIVKVPAHDFEREQLWIYHQDGRAHHNTHLEMWYDLVLEVPDNRPMFNVGDTVSINIINSFYDADFRARYHSKLATVLFINKYGAGVKTIISGDENYFSFDELIFVRRDAKEPQFKPFDKVLVRDEHKGYVCWYPKFFCRYSDDEQQPYITMEGFAYEQCIPYEGNEHLLGTTDKPKEE